MELGLAWPVSLEIARGSKWPRRLCMAVFLPDVLVKLHSFLISAFSAIRFIMFARPSLFMASFLNQMFSSGCRSTANKIRRFPLVCSWSTFLTQHKDLFHRRFLEISCCCTCVLLLGHPFPGSRFRRALSVLRVVNFIFEVLDFAVEVFLSASHT